MYFPINHTALLQVPTDGTAMAQSGAEPQGYASAGGGSGSMMTFAPIVILILLFYFLIIRPQSRARKQLEEKISRLKSGDEVLLTSGLYATVERVDGHLLYLKIGNNLVKARRNAVAALSSEADNATKKPGVFS